MNGYPGATMKPLPEAGSNPPIVATQVILHTIVGSAESCYQTFLSGVFESHFIVRLSGEVWQLMPTDRSADANYHANRRPDGTGAISIETEDHGGSVENTPWTDAQLDSIASVAAWACARHNIPAQRCSDPAGPGIGYHTLFGAPSEWTPVSKTCPGRSRIGQFDEVLARVQRILSLPVEPPTPAPPDGWLEEVLVSLPALRQGDSGPAVRRAQGLLAAAGHRLAIDGDFGPATATAVRGFRSGTGLGADGVVTTETWRRLITG